MEGPNSSVLFDSVGFKLQPQSGILPRTAVYIFKEVEKINQQFNRGYFIEVSSIEVYCESVRDLLQESENAVIELATDSRGKLILKN